MTHPFTKGDLGPFLSARLSIERAIRAQCSEHVIMQIHDAVYAPVKHATAHVHDAVQAALAEAPGIDPTSSPRHQRSRALARLRGLVEMGAKECELQDALLASGLLALNCRVVDEVVVADLVLAYARNQAAERQCR